MEKYYVFHSGRIAKALAGCVIDVPHRAKRFSRLRLTRAPFLRVVLERAGPGCPSIETPGSRWSTDE